MSMNINEDGRVLPKSSNINTNLSNGGVYLIDPAVLEMVTFENEKKYSLEYEILPSLYDVGLNSYGREFWFFY
jgi:NDP-sugar pyrophosphorylase family protein